MENPSKTTSTLASEGKANVAAIQTSSEIMSSGIHNIIKVLGERLQNRIELNISTWNEISKSKSVKEAMELQTQYATTVYENAMSDSNKLAQAWVELGQQSMKPIGLRMTAASETTH